MKLWRISNYANLNGTGGIKAPGRWHNKGIPVVYCAEHPALAMLEVLVHFELSADQVPDTYQLLEIDYPDTKDVSQLSTESLTADWQQNLDHTRSIGDEWLSSLQGVLLRVPSTILPQSHNYLLNPRHPLAKQANIVAKQMQPFDTRLFSQT